MFDVWSASCVCCLFLYFSYKFTRIYFMFELWLTCDWFHGIQFKLIARKKPYEIHHLNRMGKMQNKNKEEKRKTFENSQPAIEWEWELEIKKNIVYSNSHLSLTSWHPIYVSVTFLFVIFLLLDIVKAIKIESSHIISFVTNQNQRDEWSF